MSEEPTVLLQRVGLVHTPKDLNELESYINKFSGSGEHLVAFTCAYMAWNLAAKLTNPEGRSANDE